MKKISEENYQNIISKGITMESFEELRHYLFAIAYRMLGSVNDAEDIVQEAYLRFQKVDESKVQSPKAYLSTIVTRLCLDYIKSAKKQREHYVGLWLPEPLLISLDNEPSQFAEMLDSISFAFLMMLERLTATERAVFLLREVFDYDYDNIAMIIGKKESTCRQYFHRAKKHLISHHPRFEMQTQAHKEILNRFLFSCQTGDLKALEALLAEEVISFGDGGGKASAAIRPISGRQRVARFWISVTKQAPSEATMEMTVINGHQGFTGRVGSTVVTAVLIDIEGEKIQRIWAVRNPDKLRHLKKKT